MCVCTSQVCCLTGYQGVSSPERDVLQFARQLAGHHPQRHSQLLALGVAATHRQAVMLISRV